MLAQFYKSIITKKGLNLITKSQTGARIQYTRIATGDGQWPVGSDLTNAIGLRNLKQSLDISNLTILNDVNIRARGILSNEDLQEGYHIREIGLFALDPDIGEILYCIVTAITSDFFPSKNTPSFVLIDIITTVGNTETVEVIINPSAVATAADLQELNEKLEKEKVSKGCTWGDLKDVTS